MSSWEKNKEIALAVPIDLIMASEGFVPVNKYYSHNSKYLSPFRKELEPSFVVYRERNIWVDYGLSETHRRGDGINLIMKMKGFNFKEAVEYLVELSGRPLIYDETSSRMRDVVYPQAENRQRIDSVQEITSPALIAYLQNKRHIPIEIAREWCKEVHYTYLPNGRHYYGIGMQNNAGGWVIRTAPYKGCEKGMKLDIVPHGITVIRKEKGYVSPKAYLFEGFLNFLSWVVLYGYPDNDVIILNSAQNTNQLQDITMQGTKVLACYPDNDERGRRAYDDVARISGCQMLDMSEIYKREGLNDLNDYLLLQ